MLKCCYSWGAVRNQRSDCQQMLFLTEWESQKAVSKVGGMCQLCGFCNDICCGGVFISHFMTHC